MLQLNLPPYDIKVKEENGRRKIFDILRRKYLVITPEEWVRQHFINYLINHKDYPMSLLANEIIAFGWRTKLSVQTAFYTTTICAHE